MYIHPKFNHKTVDNDIAMLKLPMAVKMPVACLPNRPPVPKEMCSIMGWGKVTSTDVYGTDVLHEAKVRKQLFTIIQVLNTMTALKGEYDENNKLKISIFKHAISAFKTRNFYI